LSVEKGAYQWEMLLSKVQVDEVPHENIVKFASEIRDSDRAWKYWSTIISSIEDL
jgi:hypothetical protein